MPSLPLAHVDHRDEAAPKERVLQYAVSDDSTARLRDDAARALYLFPTKALARDQIASVRELAEACRSRTLGAAVVDGESEVGTALPERGRARFGGSERLDRGGAPERGGDEVGDRLRRGEIEARSRRHFRHSALLIGQGRARVMIDCGEDWLGRLKRIAPSAIVLTHAHGDHAGGLARGAPCPVYATEETWSRIGRFPLEDRRIVVPREPFRIGQVTFEAFPVAHSLRAPAVGYRVSRRRAAFFYVPDLVLIRERARALRGIRLYIGDGDTVIRSMARRRGRALIGHAPVRAQLLWCKEEGVKRAIFTHCGSLIVKADTRTIAERVRSLGLDYGVDASLAYDGLTLRL